MCVNEVSLCVCVCNFVRLPYSLTRGGEPGFFLSLPVITSTVELSKTTVDRKGNNTSTPSSGPSV